jgi:hypothetical protein
VPTGGTVESDKQLLNQTMDKWTLGPTVNCYWTSLTIDASNTGQYGVLIGAGGSLNKGDVQAVIVGSK